MSNPKGIALATPQLLGDPLAFWEERHSRLDPWRSGGDRGLSEAENYEFYAWRVGRLLELIRRHATAERPLSILDAGCGRGHFTDALRRAGHRVVGIDASPTAISRATESYGGAFEVSTLDSYRPSRSFDVVICIDVLFHVLDDDVWKRSLAAFSRYLTAEGLLVLTDVLSEHRFALGDYIVHRAMCEYTEILAPLDFALRERVPYPFNSNRNAFAAFRRDL